MNDKTSPPETSDDRTGVATGRQGEPKDPGSPTGPDRNGAGAAANDRPAEPAAPADRDTGNGCDRAVNQDAPTSRMRLSKMFDRAGRDPQRPPAGRPVGVVRFERRRGRRRASGVDRSDAGGPCCRGGGRARCGRAVAVRVGLRHCRPGRARRRPRSGRRPARKRALGRRTRTRPGNRPNPDPARPRRRPSPRTAGRFPPTQGPPRPARRRGAGCPHPRRSRCGSRRRRTRRHRRRHPQVVYSRTDRRPT